ncbi:MAG: response regulator [Robiginitomaculum sp.]|nr:response regulator [Robiginitomaculum sp.]
MSVVVIDDSQRIRSLMAALLRDLGCHSVCPYEGVEQACTGIEKERPTMVLCDWKMTAADGGVFLDRIRTHRDDHIASTPVIIVTGFGSRDILIEAMQKGATQFLVKPVVPRELLKKMAFVHNDDREMVRRKGRMIYMKAKPVPKPAPVRAMPSRPAVAQKHQAPVSAEQADAGVWEL